MRHFQPRFLFVVTVVCLLIAGCDLGGPQPNVTALPSPTATPTPVPTPTPTPAQLSAQIGKATLNSESFHFAIALSGKPVYTDESQFFTLNNLTGDLKRPDGVLAILKISGAGGVAEVRSVSLAGKQYITNPITRQWQCLTPGQAFDPAVLFDPTKGVEHLLQQGFESVTLVGTEDLGGKPNLHLRGSIAGPPLMAISANSLGLGTVKADLWADASTMRATQIILVDTTSDSANPTTWKITFSEYDKAVDVRAPPGTNC